MYTKQNKIVSSADLEVLVGAFGELLVGQKKDDVNVKFIYDYYNTDFELQPAVVTGDGAGSVSGGLVRAATTSVGTCLVSSKNSIRYRTGHTGYVDLTLMREGDSGFVMGGGFDSDGFFVKYDIDTDKWAVGRRYSDTDYVETEDVFNGNCPIDTLDSTKLNIFRIVFGYLGAANPTFLVKLDRWYVLHVLKTENMLTTPTVRNPSFPVSIYAEGGATALSASWNGGVIDGASVETGARFFDESLTKAIVGTTVGTLGTFRNKTTFFGIPNKVKAQLIRYEFTVDAPASGYGTVEFKIYKNAELTGTASYTDLDENNSVLEVDIGQTYSSDGRVIFTEHIQYSSSVGGSGSKSGGSESLPALELSLVLLPGETSTITAQNVAASASNVTVRAIFEHIELF